MAESLIEYAAARVGQVRAARVIAFMVQWNTARIDLGDEWPTEGIEAEARAYADWWRLSERTAWRELARFREVFPDEPTPTRLLHLLRAEQRRRGVAGLGSAPLPA